MYIKNEFSEADLRELVRFVNHQIGDFGLWCAREHGEGYELVDRVRQLDEDMEHKG
ncbi:MAG: hypothetical protein ACN4GR_16290 [Arenicellales bacterium]